MRPGPSMIAAGLGRGERAPDMVLPDASGTATRYYAQAGGRPALLIFARDTEAPQLTALATGLDGVGAERLSVHVVAPGHLDEDSSYPVLVDADGRAANAYRTGGAAIAYVLDPNLRVRNALPFDDGRAVADNVLALLEELVPAGPPVQIATQAPLLVVPDVLDAAERSALIELWESDHEQTGVEATTDGRRAEQVSTQLKRRSDHIVRDPQRSRELAGTVGRRVMPELLKSFAYRGTRFEGFKIACYEASDRGFFSAHRDNLSPSTAHRRFALTLNLNDEYEGGQLRFPEYGPDLYRPPPGAALLFSCSHLHEVLDVTAGRRFVLLSFVFSDPPPQAQVPAGSA